MSPTTPLFSVIIPARGRPNLLRDAIRSVVLQQFDDVQLIVSNNGGGAVLRDVVAEAAGGVRLTYVEQPTELCMPDHWELISRQSQGRYMIFLTDRSVLRAGSLQRLAEIVSANSPPSVVSWPWDIYFDDLGLLEPHRGLNAGRIVSARAVLLAFAKGKRGLDRVLPRGLNSCVSNELVDEVRRRFGASFARLNPDYSFAFRCLALSPEFRHVDMPLMISQGVTVSNGLKGYFGDPTPYLNSLGLTQPFVHVPLVLPLVQNAIHEDFLCAATAARDIELLAEWSRADYYRECAEEVLAKEAYGLLSRESLAAMRQELELALSQEPEVVRQQFRAAVRKSGGFVGWLRRHVHRHVGARWQLLRPLWIRLRGGRRFASVLSAAGFSCR